MRKFLIVFALLLLPIASILISCKKGGPAQPYDVKLQGTSGNLDVVVTRQGSIQIGVTVLIVDNKSVTYTSVTANTGIANFTFDYAKYFVEQTVAPSFNIIIPEQEHYAYSSVPFTPVNGPNTFTYSNDPTLTTIGTSSSPQSYTYNATNTLWFVNIYDKGGSGNIPISQVIQNLPSGWGLNYGDQVLGNGVTQTGVTFTIPQYEYRQAPISFWGLYADNPVTTLHPYVSSQLFSITRGFPVSLQVSTVANVQRSLSMGGGPFVYVYSCGVSFVTTNGSQIPWTVSYSAYGYIKDSGYGLVASGTTIITGSGVYTIAQDAAVSCATNFNEGVTIKNSDAGITYTYSGTSYSFTCNASATYTASHSTSVY